MNVVYFFQRGDGCIKIGTTRNCKERFPALTRQHKELALLGIMTGDQEVERQLHARFSQHRIGRTEFFKANGDLLEFISGNAKLELAPVIETQVKLIKEGPPRSIINRVPDLVALKFGKGNKISIRQVAQDANIAYHVASLWITGRPSFIELELIGAWCKYLQCQPSDIFEYVPRSE